MKTIIISICLLFTIGVAAQENLTIKQKNDAKNALFDSYNIIVSANENYPLDSIKIAEKQRNVEHINIMLKKEWLIDELTNEEINNLKNILK